MNESNEALLHQRDLDASSPLMDDRMTMILSCCFDQSTHDGDYRSRCVLSSNGNASISFFKRKFCDTEERPVDFRQIRLV